MKYFCYFLNDSMWSSEMFVGELLLCWNEKVARSALQAMPSGTNISTFHGVRFLESISSNRRAISFLRLTVVSGSNCFHQCGYAIFIGF